jgi:hypothetical protein
MLKIIYQMSCLIIVIGMIVKIACAKEVDKTTSICGWLAALVYLITSMGK